VMIGQDYGMCTILLQSLAAIQWYLSFHQSLKGVSSVQGGAYPSEEGRMFKIIYKISTTKSILQKV
jgi:hypothetical protein